MSPVLSVCLMIAATAHPSPAAVDGDRVPAVAGSVGAMAGGVIVNVCLVVLVEGVGRAPAMGEWWASAVNEGWLS